MLSPAQRMMKPARRRCADRDEEGHEQNNREPPEAEMHRPLIVAVPRRVDNAAANTVNVSAVKRTRNALRSAAAAAGIVLQARLSPRRRRSAHGLVPQAGRRDRARIRDRRGRMPVRSVRPVPGTRAPAPGSPPRARPSRASHCRHNEIDSEAGRTSGLSESPSKACSPAPLPSATLVGGIADPSVFRSAAFAGRRDNDIGPPGAAALRC